MLYWQEGPIESWPLFITPERGFTAQKGLKRCSNVGFRIMIAPLFLKDDWNIKGRAFC